MFEIAAFGLYWLWLAFGATDFFLHRKTDLPATSGLAESALHGAQLCCIGLGVVAWLTLANTRSLAALLLGLAGVHVFMAYADTSSADGKRRITPAEQHIHSVLDACPWIFAVGCAWLAEPSWSFRWEPKPIATWTLLLVPAVLMTGMPWAFEIAAVWRYRQRRSL